jgi:hypothetical protein
VQALHAHSQFCISGDSTLEAAKHAIEQIAKEDVDEKFVIVLSDANLDRYGIPPKKLAEIVTMDDDVNAFVIFIGTLGDQAQRFVCDFATFSISHFFSVCVYRPSPNVKYYMNLGAALCSDSKKVYNQLFFLSVCAGCNDCWLQWLQ